MLTREDIQPHQHLFNSQDWKEFNKTDKDGNPDHNRFLVDPTAKVFRYLLNNKHKQNQQNLTDKQTEPYHD